MIWVLAGISAWMWVWGIIIIAGLAAGADDDDIPLWLFWLITSIWPISLPFIFTANEIHEIKLRREHKAYLKSIQGKDNNKT